MSLDPRLAAVLAELPALDAADPVASLRAWFAAAVSRRATHAAETGRVTTREVGPEDDPVTVRCYRPDAGTSPMPALLWMHGGGWVAGGGSAYDAACRLLARELGALVVAVDYRLAPEHRFPEGLDDGIEALRWLTDEVAALGVNPGRLLVGGDGAGAGMATALTLHAQELGPPLAGQLLLTPVTDCGGRGADDTINGWYASRKEHADGPLLGMGLFAGLCAAYLGEEFRDVDPRATPIAADTLEGLPPAVVVVAEADPLRDDGVEYAAALEQAGVPVRLTRVSDLVHGFPALAGLVPAADAALTDACTRLRELAGD